MITRREVLAALASVPLMRPAQYYTLIEVNAHFVEGSGWLQTEVARVSCDRDGTPLTNSVGEICQSAIYVDSDFIFWPDGEPVSFPITDAKCRQWTWTRKQNELWLNS